MRAAKIVFVGLLMVDIIGLTGAPRLFGQQSNLQQNAGQQTPQQATQQQALARQQQLLRQPFPQLSEKHLQYLDQLLTYWETSSSKIQRYKCEFRRWVYDEAFLAKRDSRTNHLYARTVATGMVRYAHPDKGMYESDNVWKFVGLPEQQGGEPKYEKIKENERWICNGQSIFEFKFNEKKLIERPLPPEMRGKRIADGPLPFLFGAKADEMKQRYWIRVITPDDVTGEYWLEAFPKRIADAQDMQKVEIILDEKDFLPKAITVYEVNHAPEKQLTRKTTFEFSKREYNWHELPAGLQKFIGNFSTPRTPLGWEKIVVALNNPAPTQPQRQAQAPFRFGGQK